MIERASEFGASAAAPLIARRRRGPDRRRHVASRARGPRLARRGGRGGTQGAAPKALSVGGRRHRGAARSGVRACSGGQRLPGAADRSRRRCWPSSRGPARRTGPGRSLHERQHPQPCRAAPGARRRSVCRARCWWWSVCCWSVRRCSSGCRSRFSIASAKRFPAGPAGPGLARRRLPANDAAPAIAIAPGTVVEPVLPAALPARPGAGRRGPICRRLWHRQRPQPRRPPAATCWCFRPVRDSWITVTEAGGKTLLSRTVKAGETVSLSGAVPLSVVVGRAAGVDVRVRGKAFDLGAADQIRRRCTFRGQVMTPIEPAAPRPVARARPAWPGARAR